MHAIRSPRFPASDFTIGAMVIAYIVGAATLFSRFIWLCPLSGVSLATGALSAVCLRETWRDPARGLLVLSFLTPLTGNLHHLAPERCPAPLLLVIAAFGLGWLMARRENADVPQPRETPGAGAATVLFLLVAVSGVLTAWRYLGFVPIGDWPGLDASVNVKHETVFEAVGDIWQTLVVGLSGPLLFLIVARIPTDDAWLGRWVRVVLAGVLLAFLFGLVQLLFIPSLGNVAYWVSHNRINATFTDPNGLGTFVALIVPLAAAMALCAGDRPTRFLGAAVVLLGLVMLARSGSRTGALGIVLAAVLFPAVLALRFRREREEFRQAVLFSTLVVVVAIVAFTPRGGRWEGDRWVLFERLAKTREMMARQGLFAPLIRERWPLWEPAAYFTGRYPVGGIGLGALGREIENTRRLENKRWGRLDNANNLYLQIASELGLVGLTVALAVLAIMAAGILRVVRAEDLEGESRAIYVALATAWMGFLLLFMTGPHLLFEQIQTAFWLCAAVFTGHLSWSKTRGRLGRRWGVAAGCIAVVIMAGGQLATGFGELSPVKRRAALGLEQGSGFYAWETDETGRRFRWTRKTARLTVPTARHEIRIETRASHPDLGTRLLVVWFTIDGKLAGRREITSPGWQWVRLAVPAGAADPAELVIRVERTWRPPNEDRDLGISVGRVRNVESTEVLPP